MIGRSTSPTIKGNHTIKIGGQYQDAFTKSRRDRARTGWLLLLRVLLSAATTATARFGSPAWSAKANPCRRTERAPARTTEGRWTFIRCHQPPHLPKVAWPLRAGQLEGETQFHAGTGVRWDVRGARAKRDNLGAKFLAG